MKSRGMLTLLIVIFVSIMVVACSSDESSEISPPQNDIPSSNTPQNHELPPSSFLPEIPRISIHEVKSKLDSGANMAIVDSRDQKYYDKSHIAGAISLPLNDMSEPYSDLDGYDEITTYCT